MTANPDSSGPSPGPVPSPHGTAHGTPDAGIDWVDEALAPLRDFLSALAEVPAPLADPATGEGLRVESIRIAMPFEMDAEVADGRVRIAAGPPTQYTETTVMPVFHRLELRIEADPPPLHG